MASTRRFSMNQVMQLVEGAETLSQATGLSISEIVNLVLSEPAVEEVEDAPAEPRPRLASGT